MRYNEPAKARKLCPSCNMYSHARTLICDCGHSFKENVVKQPAVTQYDLPSRGRKECPACRKFVGVRTQQCLCGHDFDFDAPKATQLDKYQDSEDIQDRILMFKLNAGLVGKPILTPAGHCPVKLTSADKNTVYSWCQKLIAHPLENSHFSYSAIVYFVRQFFNMWTEEYRSAVKFVNQFVDNIVGEQ